MVISLCQHCGRADYGCDCSSFKTSLSYPTIYYGHAEDTDLVQLRLNLPATTLLIVALEELRYPRSSRGAKDSSVLLEECDDLIAALVTANKLMARFVSKDSTPETCVACLLGEPCESCACIGCSESNPCGKE